MFESMVPILLACLVFCVGAIPTNTSALRIEQRHRPWDITKDRIVEKLHFINFHLDAQCDVGAIRIPTVSARVYVHGVPGKWIKAEVGNLDGLELYETTPRVTDVGTFIKMRFHVNPKTLPRMRVDWDDQETVCCRPLVEARFKIGLEIGDIPDVALYSARFCFPDEFGPGDPHCERKYQLAADCPRSESYFGANGKEIPFKRPSVPSTETTEIQAFEIEQA